MNKLKRNPPASRQERKTAQEIQDDIFRKMPADKKIKLGSEFWLFAKKLSGNNFYYGRRPKASFGKNR